MKVNGRGGERRKRACHSGKGKGGLGGRKKRKEANSRGYRPENGRLENEKKEDTD